MADPASAAAGGFFGVKLASLVAGFAGGVVSLSYLRELSRWQMALAVAAGSLTAGYITPVVLHYIAFKSEIDSGIAFKSEMENGIAFLIGLTAMNIVPGFINLADRFRNNPSAIFNKGEDK